MTCLCVSETSSENRSSSPWRAVVEFIENVHDHVIDGGLKTVEARSRSRHHDARLVLGRSATVGPAVELSAPSLRRRPGYAPGGKLLARPRANAGPLRLLGPFRPDLIVGNVRVSSRVCTYFTYCPIYFMDRLTS
jgi:hypothetical protein